MKTDQGSERKRSGKLDGAAKPSGELASDLGFSRKT